MNFLRVVLITLAVALPIHAQVTSHWTFEEHQLPIEEGGRMNSIAVDPINSDHLFVASETGGLFESTDGGLRWMHVDELPVIFTQSVVVLQSGAVLVSAKADFKRINGGGVWRRESGQSTWTQTLLHRNLDHRLSAYEISVQRSGGVWVGTSMGLFQSSDGGVSWGGVPIGDAPIISVLATEEFIYLGGPSGVRVTNVFSTTVPVPNPGAIHYMHAFATSSVPSHVLVANSATQLFVSTNDGAQWTLIDSAPLGGNCGGAPFIKAVDRSTPTTQFVDLYFSNRCRLYKRAAPVDDGTIVNYFGSWDPEVVDRDYPRDLGFDGNVPRLLGTTAGLHHRPAGATAWSLVGGGREGGYNALQINEVRGQLIGGSTRADLYIGTQDNKLWAWRLQTPNAPLVSHGTEGHFIELPRRAAPLSDCKMTFVSNQQRKKSEELFDDVEPWLDAPGEDGAPAMIRQGRYVQQVRHSGVFRDGMAITYECGKGWGQFARFAEEPRDLPKLGRAGDGEDPESRDIVYQAYRSTGGRNLLMRIERPVSATDAGTVFFPMEDPLVDFGGLGINPTMFAWYQVYAVDPGEPYHLMAADVVHRTLRESTDGGASWTGMDLTTQLLGANFVFRAALNGPAVGEIFPIVTAISFSPQDPRLVLVGTSEAGIFASKDNGQSWSKIPGSERVTYVTSFYWETANTVFVSTYGRGLWKLRNRRIAAPFEDFCGSCEVVSNDSSSSRPPFDGSAIVFDGRMLGVRSSNSQLREVFVTPGSSVVFTGDLNDPQDDIAITESDGRDTTQFDPLPKGPDGWIAAGVVFTSDDKPVGTAFAKAEMTLLPPPSGKQFEGPTESPTEGRPYIRLTSSANRGVATVVPEEVFELAGTGFPAGASYEVLVDGEPVKGTYTADGKGAFAAKVVAPSVHGYHTVGVRMEGDETLLDASMFLVRNGD